MKVILPMLLLVSSASFGAVQPFEYVTCTNCSGVGCFEFKCDKCNGKGLVHNPRWLTEKSLNSPPRVACPKCTKGLIKKGSKGTGVVKVRCRSCLGSGKVKK